MKKYFLLLILFPLIGLAQTYTVIQQPTYGQDPKYTPTIYTVKQTTPVVTPNYIGDALNQVQQNMNASRALRAAEQAVINQNRIENEKKQQEYLEKNRLQELEKKRIEEAERIEEEKNPNSILNKFKNTKLKQENEDLKNKLVQMEILLSEKEKTEKERLKKEHLEKERIENENIQNKNSKKNK